MHKLFGGDLVLCSPSVYGGVGVHVDYLSRELAKQIEVDVHYCRADGDLYRLGSGRYQQRIDLAQLYGRVFLPNPAEPRSRKSVI